MTDSDGTDSESGSFTLNEFAENRVDETSKTQDRYKSLMQDSDDELDAFPAASDERLLKALAADPEKPRTHKEFGESTDLDADTITNTLEQLEAQGLVDDRGGRYFIPESRQSTVDGLLTGTR